eukprot:TRINITY_DN113528_c0_g1_i1.p1 TRINITY_DN113528_c0_g1~~TRINITY_DN113528_c0_g1_i1.p1  ORF type:complete len:384 (-),score=74.85 TRINITY_DN113528_c0_g1_i1:144-1184(-)
MRAETLTELCAKHGIERPADTRGKRFSDFGPFASCYMAVCECLRQEEDIFRLVREVAEDAASAGALWIEPALSCVLYAHRFGGLQATLRVLLRAAAAAEKSSGVSMGFIVAAERHLPAKEAEELASAVKELVDSGGALLNGRLGIIGFGLHSAEVGNPPAPFAAAFKIACQGGVVALPHAGELAPEPGGGPSSVRFCVDELGARRIAHGVLAVEDDELVSHLAKLNICLDVCPSSNELLGVVPGPGLGPPASHPLVRLLKANVPCTINSDDPLLFGCNLLGEFERCREDLKLSDEELASCAANSFRHSRAPESLKQRGLAGVAEWLRASGDGGPAVKRPRSAALDQ